MKTLNTNFSDFSRDLYLRNDVKYHNFINNTNWNLFNAKNYIKLKDVLVGNYENFDFQDDEEYFGIPTGQSYIDEDGYIIDSQLITKEEHPNRLKYKINKDNILISSLRLAKSPALNFENIDFDRYVFSNGFYIFKIEKNWNKKFILYLLRNEKIKFVIDNCIYRGIGISAYKEFDLLNLKIPNIPLTTQNSTAEKILPIENKIKELKAKIKDKKLIINEVFAREFGFDINLYNELGKGMTAGTQTAENKTYKVFKVDFSSFANSYGVRFSTRFHNTITKKLINILANIKTKKVKDVLLEKIHRGASPEYDKEGEIPVIKIAHLKNSYIDYNFEEFVSLNFYEKSLRTRTFEGDILLSSTGKVSLGKIDINNIDAISVVDSHISLIRINNKIYNHLFFIFFFRSVLGYFQIERDYTGTTNQIELYPSEISNFLIPDIPLSKQQKIVEEIKKEIDKQNEFNIAIASERKKIDELIESVLM